MAEQRKQTQVSIMASRSISAAPVQQEAKRPSLPTHIAKFILHQWLIIGFGLACLLAYLFPEVAKHGGIIKAEYSILYGAVAFIFLMSGLSIAKDKLLKHVLNYRLHVKTQAVSFLMIPAIMCGLVRLIDVTDHAGKIDRAVLAGYIVLSCLPTTIASNVVMTRAAGGDEAAALLEVFLANVLGPFITPGWAVTLMPRTTAFEVWQESNKDLKGMYESVFKRLGLSVFLPLVVGQAVRWLWAEKTVWAMQKLHLAKLSTVCLILVIWASFSTCFSTGALKSLSSQTLIFIMLLNVSFYIALTGISFLIAHPPSALVPRQKRPSTAMLATTTSTTAKLKSLPHALLACLINQSPPVETIAICFCGPAKTTSLGIPMVYAMYPTVDLLLVAKLAVPVILYTTEQVFCAHFMVRIFKWWGKKREAEWKEKERGEALAGCDLERASPNLKTGSETSGIIRGERNGVSADAERGEEQLKEIG
ncbi:hypothetical protein GX48_07043 [Paracoccidioides brasiliensis]|nr:hypothetical protein GX48_07043 [Paracoccidioides brasiliensis]